MHFLGTKLKFNAVFVDLRHDMDASVSRSFRRCNVIFKRSRHDFARIANDIERTIYIELIADDDAHAVQIVEFPDGNVFSSRLFRRALLRFHAMIYCRALYSARLQPSRDRLCPTAQPLRLARRSAAFARRFERCRRIADRSRQSAYFGLFRPRTEKRKQHRQKSDENKPAIVKNLRQFQPLMCVLMPFFHNTSPRRRVTEQAAPQVFLPPADALASTNADACEIIPRRRLPAIHCAQTKKVNAIFGDFRRSVASAMRVPPCGGARIRLRGCAIACGNTRNLRGYCHAAIRRALFRCEMKCPIFMQPSALLLTVYPCRLPRKIQSLGSPVRELRLRMPSGTHRRRKKISVKRRCGCASVPAGGVFVQR